jgi:hypothetical protein
MQTTVHPRTRLGGAHVPRGLVLTATVGLAVPVISTGLGLYDRIQHWGKFVHALDGFAVAVIVALLLLGWRDREHIDLTDELAALFTMFAGLMFGLAWETVEFAIDWVWNTSLQKSNADTMTDFLWNDLAVVAGTLLAVRLYCRSVTAVERRDLGAIADRLLAGPSRLLDHHARLITVIVSALLLLVVLGLWFAGRPVPGFPIG